MESKKINQLATELSPALDDLTIIGDPTTGISRKITLSQMASLFTGTVEEYASLAAFPLVGTADTIYIALDTNILYRWNGSAYVELSPNIVSSLVFNDANGFDGTITLVGSVATLTITTALTLGSLPFIGASGALTQDNNNLFYDDTNNRLGIGTNAPTTPLDVFGSGIISRINGTSTNNGFLGFASAGSNKWSVGNVQSDHRFRIFSEANTSELVSLLQTGEFGIGIANPTTKIHLDGGASALIANLDANVSVAKSLSFRSDNSNRINLEVSGTESGSNAGANFFIRRYSDAGALIDTPFTITRSTGLITLATALAGLSASFSSTATASAFIPSGSSVPTNGMYLSGTNTLDFATNSTNRLSISSAGAATFSGLITSTIGVNNYLRASNASTDGLFIENQNNGNTSYYGINNSAGSLFFTGSTAYSTNIGTASARDFQIGTNGVVRLTIASTGAATFSGALSGTSATFSGLVDVSKSGQAIRILASSTDATYQQIQNTSGNMIVGNESSVGGSVFTGTSAYAGIIGTASTRDMCFGTNSAERMRITSDGSVLINKTTDNTTSAGVRIGGNEVSIARSSGSSLICDRLTDDGTLVVFRQANFDEGSISVSGNTVSYNSFLGSHWSQLSDRSKQEILKGTVIDVIDEMCVWENEKNDRLPKSKINDTLESTNVYGVFLAWDEDYKESNDFYVASVGLGYIRVNKNENISLGDLLQSNGDGTAKIQKDDIIRSSTIAKVVSTNKIEIYDDGSYLIAATLHCG